MARSQSSLQKALNRKNANYLKTFINELISMVNRSSRAAMVEIGQKGLQKLVDSSGFSDYTGMMRNSYQAAIFTKGKQPKISNETRTSKEVVFSTGEEVHSQWAHEYYRGKQQKDTFHGPHGEINLMTSFDINGTTPISFREVGRDGYDSMYANGTKGHAKRGRGYFGIRNKRNPKSANVIRARKIWRERNGYGRNITQLRGYTPKIKSGYAVVFNNPTPYARLVHNGNKGSNVFPTTRMISSSEMISILSVYVKRSIKARRKKR